MFLKGRVGQPVRRPPGRRPIGRPLPERCSRPCSPSSGSHGAPRGCPMPSQAPFGSPARPSGSSSSCGAPADGGPRVKSRERCRRPSEGEIGLVPLVVGGPTSGRSRRRPYGHLIRRWGSLSPSSPARAPPRLGGVPHITLIAGRSSRPALSAPARPKRHRTRKRWRSDRF